MRNLATMLQASWQADRIRSIGALVTTASMPVTRPLRAIGLGILANGVLSGDRDQAMRGALIVAGLTAANRILDWASLTIRMRLREHTVLLLDQRVMALTAGVAGLEHHERPEHQDNMELLRVDRGFLVNPFMPIAWTLSSVVQLVATVIVLASLHPLLGLLPLAGLPSLLAGVKVERMREVMRNEQAERSRLLMHLLEVTTKPEAGKEIRVFDLGEELLARHRSTFDNLERRQVRHNLRAGAILVGGWTTFSVGYMGAVAFVVARVLGGDLTPGDVVMTVSMGAQLNSQLSELVQNASWFARTAMAIGRYRWLMDYAAASEKLLTPIEPAAVPDRFVEGIALRDVDFTYPGTDVPVLEGVDLQIPAGSTIAIVGENGAGKTTLVKLLCRFYEPTSGSITVDGVELRRFDVEEWRQVLSAGFQDFARLQLVARESVGVGAVPRIDQEPAVVGALSRAAAQDLPATLPDGLSTQLGRDFEGGIELSIGQWQKVALGRAMMREPLLLVLDEPTASLDAHTEHALFERFVGVAREAAQRSGAITILVSHRFSTVRMADVILVVGEGRILEAGSHDELMARQGRYAELYTLQARGYQ